MNAIVLAGGRGARLAPYTTILPKPLMPVGDTPILELLVCQLRAAGVDRVTLAVGHLGLLLQSYFGDGRKLGIQIEYSFEDEPLGTAGPLRLIEWPEDPVLVMNGDLLTDLAFDELISTHHRHNALVTIGAHQREVKIDLGVLAFDSDGSLTQYVEKPVHTFSVSMGVYVMNRSVVDYIPAGVPFDLPDLIQQLLAANEKVVTHVHDGYWLDIGRPDDFQRAQEDVDKIRDQHRP